jgi:hypothetical protein
VCSLLAGIICAESLLQEAFRCNRCDHVIDDKYFSAAGIADDTDTPLHPRH